MKNGELLKLMSGDNFEALVTVDKNLRHQQSLKRFKIRVFILNALDNKLPTLTPFVKALEREIGSSMEKKVLEIDLDS